jgi:hypothetical protein
MGTGVDEPSIHAPACFLVRATKTEHARDLNNRFPRLHLPQLQAEFLTAANRSRERLVAATALALALHVLALWAFVSSMTFHFVDPEERKPEPKFVAVAPRIVPPPPDLTRIGPIDVVKTQPRFRPRLPAMVREQVLGDPALAIWKYLCNRDYAISDATQVGCPSFSLGSIGLGVLDPLNRTGDVGALFGADTTSMTLDEAAVARGWIKPPPPKGQTGLATKTDKSHADPTERLGPMPWDEGLSKGTTTSWSKDRPEVVPDLQ